VGNDLAAAYGYNRTQPVRSSHARNSHMTHGAVLDLSIMDLPVVWMFALYRLFNHVPAKASGRTVEG
jgi:hypothetical protein